MRAKCGQKGNAITAYLPDNQCEMLFEVTCVGLFD